MAIRLEKNLKTATVFDKSSINQGILPTHKKLARLRSLYKIYANDLSPRSQELMETRIKIAVITKILKIAFFVYRVVDKKGEFFQKNSNLSTFFKIDILHIGGLGVVFPTF